VNLPITLEIKIFSMIKGFPRAVKQNAGRILHKKVFIQKKYSDLMKKIPPFGGK
jgi:predicted peroxiredoxin